MRVYVDRVLNLTSESRCGSFDLTVLVRIRCNVHRMTGVAVDWEDMQPKPRR